MASNVYNRLHEDSVKKKQRIIYSEKYERYPEEKAEWQKKLLASNYLSMPKLNCNSPFIQTARSKKDLSQSKEHSLSAFDMIGSVAPPSSSFMSFPPRKMKSVKMESGRTVTSSIAKKYTTNNQTISNQNISEQIKLPNLRKTKKIDMHSHESIMNDPNMNGVESFPLPHFALPKGFEMVPCKSSLCAFYDMQGTF